VKFSMPAGNGTPLRPTIAIRMGRESEVGT
jgi:hypothetical protein